MKTKYLYGASVQGIQSFVFQTNELKDIVGASDLVQRICTEAFDTFSQNGTSIIRAAGNIKHLFDEKEACENAVRYFSKKVMEMAPGITISQAVVPIEESDDFSEKINLLENRIRIQRNKPAINISISLQGMLRTRKTGLAAVKIDRNNDYLDLATVKKRERISVVHEICSNFYGEKVAHDRIPYNIEDVTRHNSWIAIIHADGNGLGQIVQKVGGKRDDFRLFSQKLDEATLKAARQAYEEIAQIYQFDNLKKIPIRPIVLGGDDLTIICRADFAVQFTEFYLKAFEDKTQELLGDLLLKYDVFGGANNLTACAGISFIKASYPFYYGYSLAENLCDKAKADAKKSEHLSSNGGLAPSCLMFHKVQDSFVESYSETIERQLQPQENHSYLFGPYYLKDIHQRWSISKLLQSIDCFVSKDGNALKSHLRQWCGLMFDNMGQAEQKKRRIQSTFSGKAESSIIALIEPQKREGKLFYPVYDVLSLNSVIKKETKEYE